MAKQKLGDRVLGLPIVERVVDACVLLIYAGWLVGCALFVVFFGAAILAGFLGGSFELQYIALTDSISLWARVSSWPVLLFWAAAVTISLLALLKGGRTFLNGLTEIRESL